MGDEKLAILMLKCVLKLRHTPITIVSDQGSVFWLQATKELDKSLDISPQLSNPYHPRMVGRPEIARKVVKKYVLHFTWQYQDDWEFLLPTSKFLYNTDNHVSIGVSLFKGNF